MAIQKFRDPAFANYYFDPVNDCVISIYSGQSRPLKWSRAYPGAPRRVSLTTTRGTKISYRYDQIKALLIPAKPTLAAPVRASQRVADVAAKPASNAFNGLDTIKPNVDYVLFSVKNRCSQYFFANTSIQEALDRLARRGEHVAHDDVRILNTVTGKVHELGVKTITTYTLV